MEKNWWLIAGSWKMISLLNDILEKPRTLVYLRDMIIIDYYDDIPETKNRRYFQGLIRSPSWHHGRHHTGASLFSWKQSSREQPEVRPLPRAKDVGCRFFWGYDLESLVQGGYIIYNWLDGLANQRKTGGGNSLCWKIPIPPKRCATSAKSSLFLQIPSILSNFYCSSRILNGEFRKLFWSLRFLSLFLHDFFETSPSFL